VQGGGRIVQRCGRVVVRSDLICLPAWCAPHSVCP
jgi:hypothetical protein